MSKASRPTWWGRWRKIQPGWWWCEGLGSVVRRDDGWYGSQSAYSIPIVGITVGPLKSASAARTAIEQALVNAGK